MSAVFPRRFIVDLDAMECYAWPKRAVLGEKIADIDSEDLTRIFTRIFHTPYEPMMIGRMNPAPPAKPAPTGEVRLHLTISKF